MSIVFQNHKRLAVISLFFMFLLFIAVAPAYSQSIVLTTIQDNGAAGNSTSISGSGFTPGNIALNTITFGGFATTHLAFVVDALGDFPSTLVSLPALPFGDQLIVVDGNSFILEYDVIRDLLVNPTIGGDAAGNTLQLSGTGFADTLIPANSVTVGGQATTHASFTSSQGTFPAQTITLPAMLDGLKSIVIQGQTFGNAYRVRRIILGSSSGNGALNNTVLISGRGFIPISSIPANSITINGKATTHILMSTNGSVISPTYLSPCLL